ncbi:unnamed protein product [Amoebophrya sp. A120]|nr:unnamed protein product [Amoebophrya sp. A120]|eukprot:GSA120T00013688001.1
MAFRFRREGNYTKHRKHMENMGLQPWLDDFRWRVCNFQYHWYLGPKAHQAIEENAIGQREIPYLQNIPSREQHVATTTGARNTAAGQGLVHHVARGQHNRSAPFRTFLPNIVPQRKQSNPFCLSSHNSTGWVEARGRTELLTETKPRTKHQVSGTDDRIPEMPKFR